MRHVLRERPADPVRAIALHLKTAAAAAKKAAEEADPRYQLLDFFNDGDYRGPFGMLRNNSWTPSGTAATNFFSVWRPTSLDAINMMMDGRATGKGLNVKGKSAKMGRLSGFVPFLQISEEAHKTKVSTSPAYSTVRVYYASEALRSAARVALQPMLSEMVKLALESQAALTAEGEAADAGDGGAERDDGEEVNNGEEGEGGAVPALSPEQHLMHITNLTKFVMDHPSIQDLDGCEGVWGLELPERLLWEAYVMRQDISHPPGWETGRGSEPDYMDMNMMSTRKVGFGRRARAAGAAGAGLAAGAAGAGLAAGAAGAVALLDGPCTAHSRPSDRLGPRHPRRSTLSSRAWSCTRSTKRTRCTRAGCLSPTRRMAACSRSPQTSMPSSSAPEGSSTRRSLPSRSPFSSRWSCTPRRCSARPTSGAGRTAGSRCSRGRSSCARTARSSRAPSRAHSARSARMGVTASATTSPRRSSGISCTSRAS